MKGPVRVPLNEVNGGAHAYSLTANIAGIFVLQGSMEQSVACLSVCSPAGIGESRESLLKRVESSIWRESRVLVEESRKRYPERVERNNLRESSVVFEESVFRDKRR
jgi:hypothetical protein